MKSKLVRVALSRLGPLRSSKFAWFFAGDVVSQLGSQFTSFALPLVVVVTLHGSAAETGGLVAISSLAVLAIDPVIGVIVDRYSRRRMLLASSCLSAVVIGVVPLAVFTGMLSLALLYAVVVASSAVGSLRLARFPFYPSLVSKDALVDANVQLNVAQSGCAVVGPGLAGVVAQAMGPPMAMLADAVSFLVAGASIVAIGRVDESDGESKPRERSRWWRELATGARASVRDGLQRAITIQSGIQALVVSMWGAVYELYAIRELHVRVATLGIIAVCGAVASLVGGTANKAVTRRLGMAGTTCILGAAMWALSPALVALASPSYGSGVTVALLVGSWGLRSAGVMLTFSNTYSIRQLTVGRDMLGRVFSIQTTSAAGLGVLGGLVAGSLGATLGPRTVFGIATLVAVSMPLVLAFSPALRSFELPTGTEDQ